jgi:predicted histone-like DNA-binding protein
MAILYKTEERGNPQKPADPKKWYAHAITSKRTDLKELAQAISDKSTTVSRVDVEAVLIALTEEMRTRVANGESVHLGDFGSFRATVNSTGEPTEKDVNASSIESVNLRFQPGKAIADVLTTADLKKAQ